MPATPQPHAFVFDAYGFEPAACRAWFRYQITFADAPALTFQEELVFPAPFSATAPDPALLARTLESVHLMLGISYYKLYCPPELELPYALTATEAAFWTTVYQQGLGEFFYRNQLDPAGLVFPSQAEAADPTASKPLLPALPPHQPAQPRALLGIGGGKDSIVAAELLLAQGEDVTAFVLETAPSPLIDQVIATLDLPALRVTRRLDPQLFSSLPGSTNGHVPISAIIAFVGYLTALLYDYASVIVGNEQSSDSGNTTYRGLVVNHQWSKSSAFEALFQEFVRTHLSPRIRYFSLLRPFHEIRIAQLFARYPRSRAVFSSCNRNFRIQAERPSTRWCGECPKCLFAFLILAPFIERAELLRIFGQNLLAEATLLPLARDLLGLGSMKPFDCVGTFEEARVAYTLAREAYADTAIVQALGDAALASPETCRQVFQTSDAPTLPDHYKLLGIDRVLILGYGQEGQATERYLKARYPKLALAHRDAQDGPDYLAGQAAFDLVIRTPGLPKRAVTAPSTTATNLFFSQITARTIGVTGTKGKSTTASLIAHLLREAGLPVQLVGNIGRPMLEALLNPWPPETIFVLELSSYQLDDLRSSPSIAVHLNLFPDHLPYHGSFAAYQQAKERIFRFQAPADLLFYHSRESRLDPEQLPTQSYPYDQTPLPRLETTLLGEHNQRNLQAALAVARLFVADEALLARAVASFQPLPHRLERVGCYAERTFYDDAISTTPESTICALETLPDVDTLFVGGEDRGYDFTALEATLRERRVRNLVLFPETGRRILADPTGFTILETASMEEAVRFAFRHTRPGALCLLSTASPSYSLWKNYEAKGDDFQHWVKAIAAELEG